MIGALRTVTVAAGIVAIVATSAPAAAESGVSNGRSYTVTMKTIEGTDPGRWHVEIGQLSGGDPAVVEAFNNAGLASARDHIDRFGRTRFPSGPWISPAA